MVVNRIAEINSNGQKMREPTPEEQAKIDALGAATDKEAGKFDWDSTFQRNILGALLQDKDFSHNLNLIEPGYFSNEVHVAVCRILKEFWQKHKALPDPFIVETELNQAVKDRDTAIQIHYKAELDSLRSYFVPGLESRQHMTERITEFVTRQRFMESWRVGAEAKVDNTVVVKARDALNQLLSDTGAGGKGEASYTLREFIGRKPAKYLCKKHIVEGSMALLYGPSGVGKSFYSIDLAFSIATGRNFQDRFPTKKSNVLYLVSEADGCFPVRLLAYLNRHNLNMDDIDSIRFVPHSFNFQESDVANRIAATVPGEWVPGLVIVDTVFCNIGGDENNPKDMNNFIKGCHAIRDIFGGATVAAVHHEGKDKSRGARGHSALVAACQSVICLDGEPEDEEFLVKCKKLTNGKPFAHYVLGKEVVAVDPLDEDNPDSLVLVWKGEGTEQAEKLKLFTELFSTETDKAETLVSILNRDKGQLMAWGWNTVKTLQKHAAEAVKGGLIAVHPDEEGKKGIAYRYYRVGQPQPKPVEGCLSRCLSL